MSLLGRISGWFGGRSAAYSAHQNYQTQSLPGWGGRSLEAGDTNRLNQAHWQQATDTELNQWLLDKLSIIRARATYESRNNSMLAGVAASLVDDVVGPDGPMLEVQSDDDAYNAALERVWRQWFSAPTFRKNVSGAALLKLWVRNLTRCGEFIAITKTDPQASGEVRMRLHPVHPRRLATPVGQTGNPRLILGVEHDQFDRPTRYWITEPHGYQTNYVPYSPDDVIHEFVLDEEAQARGIPWFSTALSSAADLRDFDDQILDAARQMADQASLLYTEHPDAPVWTAPESTTVERRTIKMLPPGWKASTYQATSPPVQYPDYRAERHREFGRPFNMPLLIVRQDASKHNYSSARLDTQSYKQTIEGIQDWLSGTPESAGTLNRLVELVAAEARFTVPELRKRPKEVLLDWTWPTRPHVDPVKESVAEENGLETGTLDIVSALAARGTTLERHLRSAKRGEEAYRKAGIRLPSWMTGQQQTQKPAQDDPEEEDEEIPAEKETA